MHCARCSLAKRSTHFNSTMSFSSTTRSAMYSPTYCPCSKPETNLSLGAYTAQGQLPDQGALINFLQKSRSQNMGNLEGGANHRLGQIRFPSVCIRVHPWPLQL